jgi:hypothetical protein
MMPERYRLLAAGIRAEYPAIQRAATHADDAIRRTQWDADTAEFLLEAAAFSVHSAYTAIERLFVEIARTVDQTVPSGAEWHRDLVRQMQLAPSGVRPAVLSDSVAQQLQETLRFRHLVRNVYASYLDAERVAENVRRLLHIEPSLERDLLAFARWLDDVGQA